MKILATGQCCDLIEDDGKTRVWRCRGGGEVFSEPHPESIEKLRNGRWVTTKDHGKETEE